MKLIGRYDSPFVRRVGISLHVLGVSFEHVPLSPFSQAADLRRLTAIGRMPALVLDSGDTLIDSAAILDYLDDRAGPSQALLPPSGDPRRKSLRILASATAACDKAISINYERRRPADKVFADWITRCRAQLDAALRELEAFPLAVSGSERLMQPEITTACMLGYVRRAEPQALPEGRYPNLEHLSVVCEAHHAFMACPEQTAQSDYVSWGAAKRAAFTDQDTRVRAAPEAPPEHCRQSACGDCVCQQLVVLAGRAAAPTDLSQLLDGLRTLTFVEVGLAQILARTGQVRIGA